MLLNIECSSDMHLSVKAHYRVTTMNYSVTTLQLIGKGMTLQEWGI